MHFCYLDAPAAGLLKVRGMEICKDRLQWEMNFKDSRGNACVFISAGEDQALASLGELIYSHPILLTIGLS